MEFGVLGDSGLRVSRLALGLAFRGQTDEHIMEATVRRALDHGITFFDSANDYGRIPSAPYGGPSERALGRAIAGCRDEVVIATKVGFELGPDRADPGGSRPHIMREIDLSLRRIGTEYVDIFLVHRRDPTTALEETVSAMADVVRQGKARTWGICNFQAWEGATALHHARRLGVAAPILMQNAYNLLDRGFEREMLPFCRAERLGVMAYSPLALGLLTGFYRPGKPPPQGSLMAEEKRDVYDATFTEHSRRVLQVVEEIANVRACPPGHVALNWVLARPEVSVAIVGCDTPEQVDANMGATSWRVSDTERAELDAVSSGHVLAVG